MAEVGKYTYGSDPCDSYSTCPSGISINSRAGNQRFNSASGSAARSRFNFISCELAAADLRRDAGNATSAWIFPVRRAAGMTVLADESAFDERGLRSRRDSPEAYKAAVGLYARQRTLVNSHPGADAAGEWRPRDESNVRPAP